MRVFIVILAIVGIFAFYVDDLLVIRYDDAKLSCSNMYNYGPVTYTGNLTEPGRYDAVRIDWGKRVTRTYDPNAGIRGLFFPTGETYVDRKNLVEKELICELKAVKIYKGETFSIWVDPKDLKWK